MGRKVMAVVAAMIVAFSIIGLTYMIATTRGQFYPNNLEHMRNDEVQEYADHLPASTYAVNLAGYVVAAFFAGFVATKMGRRWGGGSTLAFICGGLLVAWELASIAFWPQPLWFIVVSVLVMVPMALVGYRFAYRPTHSPMVTA